MLRFPALAQQRLANDCNIGAALGELGGALMDDYLATGVTDADRAGEPLLVVWAPALADGNKGDYSVEVIGQTSGQSYCRIDITGLEPDDPRFDVEGMLELATALLRVGLNGLREGDSVQLLELAELTGYGVDRPPLD
jgi:hypothetical protein